jgi:aminomethyltransferase
MTQRSPLHDQHSRLGARFVDFGGWEMPVQYESVLAEHRAVRSDVGVFDVTHLGRLAVSGAGVTEALGPLFSNDVAAYAPGRTHYTLLLNSDGGILDDLVVWRWGEEDYWVMPNAANSDLVQDRIRQAAGPRVEVEDLRTSTAMLAVQGPKAPAVLESVVGEAPGRFRTLETATMRCAGTGYTGERGGEVCVPADRADSVFEALLSEGAVPCGLGARDTLRLEAGLPLWGSDIDADTTPLEAGLDFAVAWDHDFEGKGALERQIRTGVDRRLTGLVMAARGIPRHGYRVRSGISQGQVTSGNISPMLDRGIALAYMSPPVDEGASAGVEIRGSWVEASVKSPPFYR